MTDIILELVVFFRILKDLTSLPGVIWRGFHYDKYYGKDK